MAKKTDFKIISLDPLGQGVCKKTMEKETNEAGEHSIYFIPKTLPGEEGIAVITQEKKSVQFACVEKLTKKSPLRMTPKCSHFQQCSSCHYQHVEYEQELDFKVQTLKKLMRKIELQSEIDILPAPKRFEYRNRIQLHYSLKSKLLGFKSSQTHEIIPVPFCIIASKDIQKVLQNLYENENWIKLVPKNSKNSKNLNISKGKKNQGHLEIYQKLSGEILTSWNRPYASGGFTQVFEEMNQKMKLYIKNSLQDFISSNVCSPVHGLLDLFGGNGNLSENLLYQQRICIDNYISTKPIHKKQTFKNQSTEFFHLNLYAKHALENVVKKIQETSLTFTHLLLDPPRSGLNNLNLWLEKLKPQFVIYVSCNPHTLVRDLTQSENSVLNNYTLLKVALIDLFPSTYHFETVVFLKRS